ncbi:hypothetical protein [Actinomadura livida]|uniref:Putative membrane protein YgcG n=1 Tax=Actinomadura livida TaxID=79909 RepID=A0A7W7N0P5_9ACTN|nr:MULTISPECIES: hypothetical protein [Actinomadura]MBB4777304.1 putative membrane protein YgcG [Actinomadura catellatispora]
MKPVFVGLGTAAILAAGGASAVAADSPSPSPSDSPTTEETLEVSVAPDASTVDPGKSVAITTTVKAVGGDLADVKVTKITATLKGATFAGDCGEPFTDPECGIESLAAGKEGAIGSTVNVPEEAAEETTEFTVTVTVDAAELDPATATTVLKYVVPTPTKPPTTTKPPSSSKPPTKTPTKKPSKTPKPTDSASGGDGGSSGGSSGGSGSGSVTSNGGAVPPQPNSSFAPPDPSVALPPIQAPNPSVAPSQGVALTPQSRLQGNEAPVAQDLTFERMASTQVAWLAALLVAFSLLLTQLRLGRRRIPARAAAMRAKGAHRRPRKGMFGK